MSAPPEATPSSFKGDGGGFKVNFTPLDTASMFTSFQNTLDSKREQSICSKLDVQPAAAETVTKTDSKPSQSSSFRRAKNDTDDEEEIDNIFEFMSASMKSSNSNKLGNDDSFQIFKVAQEKLDESTFESAFTSLGLENKKIVLAEQTNNLLSISCTQSSVNTSDSGEWLRALDEITAEVDKVEQQIHQQEEIELQNAISMISDAIQNKTTISLPTQSTQSRQLTATVTELYAKDMSALKNGRLKSRNKPNKQQSAKNKAQSRWDKMDALSTSVPNSNRDHGLARDFINDDFQPYAKQSQAQKKKQRKKLDW